MKIAISSILLLLVFSSSNGQTPFAVALADSLLKAGTFKAVTVDYEFPLEVRQLQQKAAKNLKNDPEWADKYIIRMVERGDRDLPYVEAMGLTMDEYRFLRNALNKGKDIIYTDTFDLTIGKVNGVITFKTSKKATVYNNLKINTTTKEIIYRNAKVIREIREYGQKFFAPWLFGYETFHAVPVSKENKSDFKSFGFCVGVNKGDNKPTLCLLFIDKPGSPLDVITISIL